MAVTEIKVVQAWTSPLDFALKADDVVQSMTGITVSLLLHRTDGSLVTIAGTVATATATGASIRYSPATGDLVKGDYRGRWKAVDGSSKVAYFPNGDPDTWKVGYP